MNCKGATVVPDFLKMDKKQQERVVFLSFKATIGDISQTEFEEMAKALIFKFTDKDDFREFSMAVNCLNLEVFASVVESI